MHCQREARFTGSEILLPHLHVQISCRFQVFSEPTYLTLFVGMQFIHVMSLHQFALILVTDILCNVASFPGSLLQLSLMFSVLHMGVVLYV